MCAGRRTGRGGRPPATPAPSTAPSRERRWRPTARWGVRPPEAPVPRRRPKDRSHGSCRTETRCSRPQRRAGIRGGDPESSAQRREFRDAHPAASFPDGIRKKSRCVFSYAKPLFLEYSIAYCQKNCHNGFGHGIILERTSQEERVRWSQCCAARTADSR